MASRNFLVPGLDPSLGVCLPLTDLLQMFQQSTPSTDLGWVVISETTPNTITHPEYATFLWLKASTGDLKYYDGSSWEYTVASAIIADDSVTMAKMDASEGLPRQVPRINVGGTAYELVSPTSLFNNGEIPLAKLVSATNGHVPYYISGAWTTTSLDAFIRVIINDEPLPAANIYGTLVDIQAGQIPYFPTVPGFVDYAFVEDVLRANQTLTSKLKFASGANGKFVKVNASGTDFDYVTDSFISTIGTLVDSQVSGTAPQALVATTLTTVRLAVETAQTWMTVASSEFTLAAGTYMLQAVVPMYYAGGAVEAYVGLYDVTAASMLKRVNAPVTVDGDYTTATLLFPLTVTTPTTYAIKAYASQAATIGKANSFAAINEVYTQVAITKLS